MISPAGSFIENPSSGGVSAPATPCMIEDSVNLVSSAQRSVGTVFQNTTGFPIFVQVYVANSLANVLYTGVTDSNASPTTVVCSHVGCSASSNTNDLTISFFVLSGNFYKVAAASGVTTLLSWREYKLTTGTFTDSGDIHASRSLTTVFQNTTPNAIFVVAQVSSVNAVSSVQGISDSNPAPTNVIDDATQSSSGASTVTVFMIVPPNHYYKITAASGSLSIWHEYTWTIPVTKSTDMVLNTGSGKRRTSIASTQSFNTGSAVATGVSPRVWLNDTNTVRWVQTITTGSAAQTILFLAGGEGATIPYGNSGQAQFTYRVNSAIPRHAYIPVMPWKFYSVYEVFYTSTITENHWWEYQLG